MDFVQSLVAVDVLASFSKATSLQLHGDNGCFLFTCLLDLFNGEGMNTFVDICALCLIFLALHLSSYYYKCFLESLINSLGGHPCNECWYRKVSPKDRNYFRSYLHCCCDDDRDRRDQRSLEVLLLDSIKTHSLNDFLWLSSSSRRSSRR